MQQASLFEADQRSTMPTRPDSIADHVYYKPTQEGNEAKIKQRLDYIKDWKARHDTGFRSEETSDPKTT